MNSYTKTKQFTEWLKGVRPDFEIKVYYPNSDLLLLMTADGTVWREKEEEVNKLRLANHLRDVVPALNLDTLHSILWELFDFKWVEGEVVMLAHQFWIQYTAGKESQWMINSDSVLDDIMDNYNKLTK